MNTERHSCLSRCKAQQKQRQYQHHILYVIHFFNTPLSDIRRFEWTLFTPSTERPNCTARVTSALLPTVPLKVTWPSVVSTLISEADTSSSLANFILMADVMLAS